MKTVAWCYNAGLSLAALAASAWRSRSPGAKKMSPSARKDVAPASAPGLFDLSAEAGERSERKPGAATPRDGLHKEKLSHSEEPAQILRVPQL